MLVHRLASHTMLDAVESGAQPSHLGAEVHHDEGSVARGGLRGGTEEV